MMIYARKNGKSLMSVQSEYRDALRQMEEEYGQLFEAAGVFDRMDDWQRTMFYLCLYSRMYGIDADDDAQPSRDESSSRRLRGNNIGQSIMDELL